jgi:hypothetical protein
MSTRQTRILVYFALTFLIITPIFADDVSTTECIMLACGTWVNNEYRNVGQWGKIVQNENGMFYMYIDVSDTTSFEKGKLIISEAWIDTEENIWFKSNKFLGEYFEGAEPAIFELNEISNSGSIWEYVFSYHGYPAEIDPDAFNYRIYYRQDYHETTYFLPASFIIY